MHSTGGKSLLGQSRYSIKQTERVNGRVKHRHETLLQAECALTAVLCMQTTQLNLNTPLTQLLYNVCMLRWRRAISLGRLEVEGYLNSLLLWL